MNHKEFKSPTAWSTFCQFILKTNRYVLNEHWANFIDIILFTAKKREMILKEGTILVRARIGHYEKEYEHPNGGINIEVGPFGINELGAPPAQKAKIGRINPQGISYLYLSNDKQTAILEVRPWLKQTVSVGYFKITSDLGKP